MRFPREINGRNFHGGGDYVRRFAGDVDKQLIKSEQMVFIEKLEKEYILQ